MENTRQPTNQGDAPDTMESADAANGESPIDPHDKDEQHRTGERQARRNDEEESPA